MRRRTQAQLDELRECDPDENSEVVADIAARTAARTVQQMSSPDIEAPHRPWHQRPVAKAGGASVVGIGLLAVIVEALLRHFGLK